MPRIRLKADQHRAASRLSLKRHRRIKRALVIAGVALLSLSLLDHAGAFGYRGDDWFTFHRKTVRVLAVPQGDVLLVRAPSGQETDVQLIGLADPTDDSRAKRCLTYAKARAENRDVVLRLDTPQTRDAAGRLLAYVYLQDKDDLNLDMAHDGMAYVDHRTPFFLRGLFDLTESEARKKERGLWKGLTFADMPAWRQAWLKSLSAKRTKPQATPD